MFTCSFYAHRSPKRKKLLELTVFFALLGSAFVKAAQKHVDEIDTRMGKLSKMEGTHFKASFLIKSIFFKCEVQYTSINTLQRVEV